MRNRKELTILIFLVLSVSLIASSVTAFLLSSHNSRIQFQMLGDISQEIMVQQPEAKQTVLKVLKEYDHQPRTTDDENILLTFGYQEKHFFQAAQTYTVRLAGFGFGVGALLFLAAFFLWHRNEVFRIKLLTSYLENVNAGGQGTLLSVSEGDFSKLQDELYKTVTALYQARDAALEAKHNFADNLSNIAHQLKTPITAISLSTQMMMEHPSPDHHFPEHPSLDHHSSAHPPSEHPLSKYPVQIQKQLGRLTHLEEALLLLSRIDAGTLTLERTAVDVFTVLTLAADNLQALFVQAGVAIDIPEMGEMEITADLDWTMEAIMNLLKNCMEHTPAGKTVHCSYEQNSLYTQILIWDEGSGFPKEDISHLFERFYRGHNAKDGGIGIGLPLSKALIEMQNGVITAGNRSNGSACFEIRIYSH